MLWALGTALSGNTVVELRAGTCYGRLQLLSHRGIPLKEVSCRSIVVMDIAIWGDQLVPFEACLGKKQGTAC